MSWLVKRTAAMVLAAGLLAAAWHAAPIAASAAFLLDAGQIETAWRKWLPVRVPDVASADVTLPTRHGGVAARVHRPVSGSSGTVVVVPGVHTGGVDEPRLARLCGRLAATGLTVVCVPLPDLRAFRITPQSTDVIEDATIGVADRTDLAPTGRVSLIGVSFAGGLAVVAAGRPALRDRLNAVVSLGGQGDLPRVLRYLTTGDLPNGAHRRPHDYAVAVVAYGAVAHLAPASQTAALADGIRAFLDASASDGSGATTDAVARVAAQPVTLADPAGAVLAEVLARDTATLGARLAPHVEHLGGPPALSPERAAPPAGPVFLLHGTDDAVIPSTETLSLAASLRARGVADVRTLLTPLVTHTRLGGAPTLDAAWHLTIFWRDLLAALRDART